MTRFKSISEREQFDDEAFLNSAAVYSSAETFTLRLTICFVIILPVSLPSGLSVKKRGASAFALSAPRFFVFYDFGPSWPEVHISRIEIILSGSSSQKATRVSWYSTKSCSFI